MKESCEVIDNMKEEIDKLEQEGRKRGKEKKKSFLSELASLFQIVRNRPGMSPSPS